jgi:hypothetical protein
VSKDRYYRWYVGGATHHSAHGEPPGTVVGQRGGGGVGACEEAEDQATGAERRAHSRRPQDQQDTQEQQVSIVCGSGQGTDDDVDVDWRGFGGRDLIPTHRKFSEGARQPRLILLATGRKQSTPIIHMRTVRVL